MKKLRNRFNALNRDEKCIWLFLAVMAATVTVFAIQQAIAVIRGAHFFESPIFGSYIWDYFMDFFNVNTWVYPGSDPYGPPAYSSYPPLALAVPMIFAFFGDYSDGSVVARSDIPTLITYFVVLLLFTALAAAALVCAGRKYGLSSRLTLALSVLMALSAPYIYLFGRGNYIFMVVAALAWFFYLYQSEKRWQRELAVVLLAFAAGLKLYPALFAAIYLKERRYGEFGKAVLYTLVLFFLPFLFFKDGFANFALFLRNLFDFQGSGQASAHNYSMPTFFYYIAQLLGGCKLSAAPAWALTAGKITAYLILPLGLFCSLFSDKKWKSFALVCVTTILFPAPSYVYSACMMLPVAGVFLLTPHKEKRDFVYLALFLLLFSPVQFGYLVQPRYTVFGLTVSNLLQHVSLLVLFTLLCVEALHALPAAYRSFKKDPKGFLKPLQ